MPEKLSQGPRIGYDASRVGAGLSRGPNRKKTMVAAPWSQTWPAPGATLDLDFANDRGYVRGLGAGRSMDAVTFTRASNATYVGADGKLVTHANQGALGNNLFQFPQDFENAYWLKASNSISPNADISPNETNTASLLTITTSTSVARIRGSTAQNINTTYIVSIYAKAATNNWLRIRNFASDCSGWFDLENGVTGTVTNGTSSIVSVGNGWYRCSIVSTTGASIANNIVDIGTANADNTTAVTEGPSIYIWGAQLEVGSTATEYFPTNINQPRFDWASTAQLPRNLILYSQDFDEANWVKGSVTANTILAPDGTMTADYVTTQSTVKTGVYQQIPVPADFPRTISAYVKKANYRYLRIASVSPSSGNVYFIINIDFDTGTLLVPASANATYISSTIETLTDGWYRVSLTGNTSISNPLISFSVVDSPTFLNASVEGADFYVWGVQVELGEQATPYIYTTSAASAPTTPLTANPTSNGLLIEESRTNRILWNRDATQTQWVKTDVTAAKDQTGIDGVANAASSLTATADGGTCIQTITLASGSRTGSVYLKRITGTGTVQVSLDGSTWSTVDLSSTEWRRIVLSGTVTNPTVGIKIATSGDAVAMDYAQVEDGAFATTPILTTTATVTRSVDSCYVDGYVFRNFYNMFEGALYLESSATPPGGLISLESGTLFAATSRISAQFQNNEVVYRYASSLTSAFISNSIGALLSNQSNKIVLTYSKINQTSSINKTNTKINGIVDIPDQFTQLMIGFATGNSRPVFSIKRIIYFPKQTKENGLQLLSGQGT